MKLLKILSISLAIACLGLIATPKPAHAFTLFGVHFFEKAKPTPTPTPIPTATPKPTATPVIVTTPAGTHIDNNNLPTTGPEESVGALLLAIVAGFVARKHWQVSHQV